MDKFITLHRNGLPILVNTSKIIEVSKSRLTRGSFLRCEEGYHDTVDENLSTIANLLGNTLGAPQRQTAKKAPQKAQKKAGKETGKVYTVSVPKTSLKARKKAKKGKKRAKQVNLNISRNQIPS